MPRKQFTSEQIITKLREAEVLLSQGMTVIEACHMTQKSRPLSLEFRVLTEKPGP